MMNLSEGTNQIMYGCPRFWHNNQYFPGLLIFLVIISSLLSFTTTLANISILFALPEVTSVHPPSKPLLRSLTMTDFGSGLIAQPLAIAVILSSLKGNWNLCDMLQFSAFIASTIFPGVTLSTLNTISLDSLLALLLGITYRHVVTFRRVRAVVFSLWLMGSFVGFLYFFNPRVYFIVKGVFGTLNLIVSSYCYTRISYIIRRYQRELQDSLGDQTTESAPPSMVVYKKSVRNTLWIHSTLVTCYLPHLVVSAIMIRSQPSLSILIAQRFRLLI